MVTPLAARNALYDAFAAGWTNGVAYFLGNEGSDPPPRTDWVRVNVQHNASAQDTLGGIGNRKFDRLGLISVQIFTLPDQGQERADQLVQDVRAIFEGKTINDVFTQASTQLDVGPDPLDFWQTNVDTPFDYLELK